VALTNDDIEGVVGFNRPDCAKGVCPRPDKCSIIVGVYPKRGALTTSNENSIASCNLFPALPKESD
jgi:hypothetical protein